jgi:hypothetical protein
MTNFLNEKYKERNIEVKYLDAEKVQSEGEYLGQKVEFHYWVLTVN